MKNHSDDPRVLLSMLWVFTVLNFFARDIHELGRPGMLDQIMSGTIDGVRITEVLMLIGGLMIEIPILMALLSLLLPQFFNRWTNVGASLVTMIIIVANNLRPDLDNVFFMSIQLIALVAIVRIACRWRSNQTTQAET